MAKKVAGKVAGKRPEGLTPKQQRFVDEYLVDLNATRAAVRAGYSARNADKIGPELLGKTRVAEAVAAATAARVSRTEVTQDYVLKNLTEVVERCMQRAPVPDSNGDRVTGDGRNVWRFEPKPVVAALKLLGEHLGMYTHRVEVETTAGLTIIEEVVRAKPPKDDPPV